MFATGNAILELSGYKRAKTQMLCQDNLGSVVGRRQPAYLGSDLVSQLLQLMDYKLKVSLKVSTLTPPPGHLYDSALVLHSSHPCAFW